ESMAFGATAAYLLYRRHARLALLLHPASLLAALSTMAFVIAMPGLRRGVVVPLWDNALAIACGVLVVQVATGRFRSWLDVRPARFLGRISYGLYMYHPLVISVLVATMFRPALAGNTAAGWGLFFICVIGGTIGVAALSYRLIESPLLALAGSSRRQVDSAGAGSVPWQGAPERGSAGVMVAADRVVDFPVNPSPVA